MYDIDTQVVIVNKHSGYGGLVGKVIDRHWMMVDGVRRAFYLVEYDKGQDVMVASKDVRLAEVQCDGCGGWRSRTQMELQVYNTGPDYDDVESIGLCFLCRRSDIQWPLFDNRPELPAYDV